MKSLIKIMILMLLPTLSIAQQKFDFALMQKMQLDSLRVLLRHAANDTLRMDAYRRLGFYYADINRDSSLYYGEQQLALAKKLKQPFWEASAIDQIGYAKYKMENYPAALNDFLQAKTMAEDPEIEKNIRGLEKNESPKRVRLKLLVGALNNMSNLYGTTGNLDKKLSILNKILIHADSIKDNLALSVIKMNLSNVYLKQNRLDSALICAQQSVRYADISGYKKYKGGVLSIIGGIYYKKKQYKIARNYYKQSLKTSQEQRNIAGFSETNVYFSDLLRDTGETDSSIFYAKKGLENFKLLHSPMGLLQAYTSLAATYKIQDDIRNAFTYLQLAKTLSDSLNMSEKEKLKQFLNIGFEEQLRLEELEKEKTQSQNQIRTYAMLAGLGVILLITLILYRGNQQKRKANTLLSHQNDQIQRTLAQLKTTQNQLIQKEKLASLGELTAGIAHEIQNPLNFVNNFAEVSVELAEELHQSVEEDDKALAQSLSADLRLNMDQIAQNGKRASNIVRAMLEHSTSSTGERQATDLNGLAEEYLKLAHHGFRQSGDPAKHSGFTATLKTDFAADLPHLDVVAGDVGRVFLNLYNNAFYAIHQRQVQESQASNGATEELAYEPTIWVSTRLVEGNSDVRAVELRVKDNGAGIPVSIREKVFQPFFTTKPTGQGTGLGLSLSYDIITKGHGGEMWVESEEGQGTVFSFRLPVHQ